MAVGTVTHGKQKDITELEGGRFEFRFSNRTTVFDVKQPFLIPEKGVTLALTNAHWFTTLARDLGIETHFIGMTGPDSMIVAKTKPVNLEFIARYYVEGDLWRRVQAGTVTAKELGFPEGHEVKRGDKLPKPRLEITTKREDTDRLLTEEEALKIGKISKPELERIWQTILILDGEMDRRISGSGLIRFDGKKEIAFDRRTGKVTIIDSFGDADESRYVEEEAYKSGKIVEVSKELFRRYYIDTGYHARLSEARAEGLPIPPLPPPPLEIVRQGTQMYKDVYERLTGREFNPDTYRELGALRR